MVWIVIFCDFLPILNQRKPRIKTPRSSISVFFTYIFIDITKKYIVLYIKSILSTVSEQGPHEKRLLDALLKSYNTLERPVANESEPLEVMFGLTLQQIIDVVSFKGNLLKLVYK